MFPNLFIEELFYWVVLPTILTIVIVGLLVIRACKSKK